jgi:hypothetical protein
MRLNSSADYQIVKLILPFAETKFLIIKEYDASHFENGWHHTRLHPPFLGNDNFPV